MNLLKNLPLAIVGIAAMFASSSCSKNNNSKSTPDQPVPANAVKLSTNVKFGNILTDAKGKTLYFFAIDANGNSGCNGGCSVVWPTFYQANLTLDNGLDIKDFDQFSYFGRGPMETYADRKRGFDIGVYSSTVKQQVIFSLWVSPPVFKYYPLIG